MNAPLYRQFCGNHPDLPVFVQDWYLDAVCEEGEWDAAVVEKGGRIVAVMPFFLKRRWGFRRLLMPPFVKHMGPYLVPEMRTLKQEHRLYAALIAQLPPVHGAVIDLHPDVDNWLPFRWAGFRQTTRYTYRLDLTDLDAVYEGINRNMRRNIKKAASEVEVVREENPEALYHLNCLSFDRQQKTFPFTFAQLQRHDAALSAHQARQLFFAVDDQGRRHSAACLIWDGRRSYYHLSGDDPALRHSGAGILLVWEAIRFAKNELGLNSFDFEGSMLRPVEAIRRQFGAQQVPYSRVWRTASPLLRLREAFLSS